MGRVHHLCCQRYLNSFIPSSRSNDVRAARETLDLPTCFKVEALVFRTESRIVLLLLKVIRGASGPSLRRLGYPDVGAGEDIDILQGLLDDVMAGLENVSALLLGIQRMYHRTLFMLREASPALSTTS